VHFALTQSWTTYRSLARLQTWSSVLPVLLILELVRSLTFSPAVTYACTDLKTKHTVACELREMIDTVRDADSARVFPQMIPVLLEILRSGEPSFHKDTLEYQFRRVLLEILHRVPYNDVIRPQALSLLSGMLHILRHDNEENGVTSCKIVIDLLRSFRALTEELVSEFMTIFQDVFRNIKVLVEETLSEDSPLLDTNIVMPSIRSFKVLAEMGMVVVTFSQSHRQMVVTMIQTTLSLNFDVLALESPAQRKAREDCEAMGSYWAGMAPTIKNPHAYADFINAQIKVGVGSDDGSCNPEPSFSDGVLCCVYYPWLWRTIRLLWRATYLGSPSTVAGPSCQQHSGSQGLWHSILCSCLQ